MTFRAVRSASHPGPRPDERTAGPTGPRSSAARPGCSDPADWAARPITLPDDPGAAAPVARADAAPRRSSDRLRRPPPGSTSPRSASHEVRLNGRRGDRRSARPRLDAYDQRLPRRDLRRHGPRASRWPNVIIGDAGRRLVARPAGLQAAARPGDLRSEVALIAQLELTAADGTRDTIATDATWRATTAEVRLRRPL